MLDYTEGEQAVHVHIFLRFQVFINTTHTVHYQHHVY